uniref:Uncharacterized protein n=1 Tax=Zea mays TaxID=4577 RepID=C4J6Y1_MAIZE|nr:unknown [Zea mays]
MGVRHEGHSFIPCFSWRSLHLAQTTWWAQGRNTTDISSLKHMTHSRSRCISSKLGSWGTAMLDKIWALLFFLPSERCNAYVLLSAPHLGAATFEESKETFICAIRCSRARISLLYLSVSFAALRCSKFSSDLMEVSICSLSFFFEVTRAITSIFPASSCFHLACT